MTIFFVIFMPAMEKLVKSNVEDAVVELFSCVPPGTLKKSIHEIFSRYLQTINNETDLEQFKLLAEDFYFLHKFLERVEEMKEFE